MLLSAHCKGIPIVRIPLLWLVFCFNVWAGQADLTWTPPTTNEDGTPLEDLGGYKIYQGQAPGTYGPPTVINDPAASSYQAEDLPAGDYYFAVTAFDTSGNESAFSNEAFKSVEAAGLPDQPTLRYGWVTEVAFPTGWNRKAKLTIQSSKVSATLSNFPVLLTADTLPSEMFDADGSYPAQNGGGDIRISSDSAGTTQLPIEVVSFVTDNNPANGSAQIWVKVTSVSSSADTDIYIWYNTSGSDTQPGRTDTYGSDNVWDSSYVGVWHLEEDPTGSAPQFNDSTATLAHGTSSNMESGDSVAAKVGNGVNADGSNESITVGSVGALEPASAVTVEAWIRRDGTVPDWATIIWSGPVNNDPWGAYGIQNANASGDDQILWKITTGSTDDTIAFTTAIASGTWYHVAGIYDGSDMYARLNGSQEATASKTGSIADYGTPGLRFFGDSTGGYANYSLDEVRISNAARSADWLNATYNNQSDPSTFVVEGTPESTGGTPTPHGVLGLPVHGPFAGPLG